MKNMRQPAPAHLHVITTIVGSAKAPGEFVAVGAGVGVHLNGGQVGEKDTIVLGGQYVAPKVSADTFALGIPVYFDGTEFTVTAGGNTLAGIATQSAAPGDTEGEILLIPNAVP